MSTALFDLPEADTNVTYGTLHYAQLPRRGVWYLEARPHVIIRAKRLFPRARADYEGRIALNDSPEVARDLAWFTDRYPLTLDRDARAAMDRGAAAHRDAEDAVAAILAGSTPAHTRNGAQTPAQQSRAYQTQAADLVTVMRRLLITDELGLGKTHSGALTFRNPDSLPGVVVVPTHLPSQWVRQLADIWPDLGVYVPNTGTPGLHFEKWAARNGGPPDVYVIPYSKLRGWQHHLQPVIRSVVFDEVQDLRNGTGTEKGIAAANISREASYVVGLSATPIYNYGGGTALHLRHRATRRPRVEGRVLA